LPRRVAANPSQQNIDAIAKLEHEALGRRTITERVSEVITKIVGNMTFLLAQLVLSMLIALACFSSSARADDDDPPTRVARLSYTQGSVSFQPAGTEDWVTAGLNRPISTADKMQSAGAWRALASEGSFGYSPTGCTTER